MRVVGLDFETYSACPITAGTAAYAAHPSTGVHLGVAKLIEVPEGKTLAACYWSPGNPVPGWLVTHVQAGGLMVALNWSFEASIIKHVLTDWPTVAPQQWLDPAQLAGLRSLPQGLADLCSALGMPVQKDKDGYQLMMSKAKVIDGVIPTLTIDERARMFAYCETDVDAAVALLSRLTWPTADEAAIAAADRVINARGMRVDLQFAAKLQRMIAARKEELQEQAFYVTQDVVSPGASPVKRYLQDRGVQLPVTKKVNAGTVKLSESLSKTTIPTLLRSEDLPADVRELLMIRQEISSTSSLAKLTRLAELVSPDGRLRYALRYCGAHTARWSSKGLQVHNLPRIPKDQQARVAEARQLIETGAPTEKLREHTPNLLQTLSYMLRSVVIAAPGHELIGGDYAAIEARVLAWLAGEKGVLNVFASGADVYMHDAAAIGSKDRQLGKVQRLALGYGMGAVKFLDTAKLHGITLDPKLAKQVQEGWRKANPAIVGFWKALEDACRVAVTEHRTLAVGRHLEVTGRPDLLTIRLPSGRRLHYWRPRIRTRVRKIELVTDTGAIETKEVETTELSFYRAKGSDQEGRPQALAGHGMILDSTYGGKLAENVTQAVSRDLLGAALVRLEEHGYRVVLHVHDSIAAEVPVGQGSVEEFCSLMSTAPLWAAGCPISVEGYRSPHFRG